MTCIKLERKACSFAYFQQHNTQGGNLASVSDNRTQVHWSPSLGDLPSSVSFIRLCRGLSMSSCLWRTFARSRSFCRLLRFVDSDIK
ncbi:hypothetical protein MPTK1_8g16500 [Marchantia polymorpha subsp. ruderalis]|uniref:Uncharacterized protein n=1 Tax=Marchantia polymorpha TaxID=3197 RepID=A0A2R6W4L1_MARPO|nr:hypothetical protein MARPO_0154s0014 [Marchantia polymorpha]BBN20109.1 hypothetical protein Mp_8g16500 [Marchantia polymorpha subsp. ruderalis]|eukprot:PTQ28784.1 hypothetical protein MARPO_0154s0014 [Marchantia polymorpha]